MRVDARRITCDTSDVGSSTGADWLVVPFRVYSDCPRIQPTWREAGPGLTRVEQAIETCRAQVHLAAALEGEFPRLAKLGEIEMSVLTLARAAEVGAIQPFQDRHGRWHGDREP